MMLNVPFCSRARGHVCGRALRESTVGAATQQRLGGKALIYDGTGWSR